MKIPIKDFSELLRSLALLVLVVALVFVLITTGTIDRSLVDQSIEMINPESEPALE